jgi:lysophospholipase L1-like esterase
MNVSKLTKWKVWFFRLLSICISIFIALVLCEIGVRIIAPQALSGTWLECSVRGGNINKANCTVRHQLKGRLLHYHFNDLHLRDGSPSTGTNRILVIGDSFTFGWLVEETNTFIHKFNELGAHDFPDDSLEFLNGGIAGCGTADYVAFVEDFAPRIHPTAIVVYLNNDDVERSVRSGLFELDAANSNAVIACKPHFVASGLREVVRSSKFYQWSLEHIELVQLVRIAFENKVNRMNLQKVQRVRGVDDPDFGIQLEKALLWHLKKWCDENHCELFILTTGYNAFPNFPLGWDDGNANRKFFDEPAIFFQRNGFIFHDLGPEMFAAVKGNYEKIVIPRDFHPDERGNELIADLSWPWLRSQLQARIGQTNELSAKK